MFACVGFTHLPDLTQRRVASGAPRHMYMHSHMQELPPEEVVAF